MLVLSFLKTAWRGMRKSIGFTAIGILSLSIGMSVWLLLTLLLRDLQQYDRFHSKADQIVRITSRSWNPSIDLMVPLASSPAPLGPVIAAALPDVEGFVRLARIGADAVRESGVIDLDVFAADSTFFGVAWPVRDLLSDAESGAGRSGSSYPLVVKAISGQLAGRPVRSAQTICRSE